MYQIRLKTSCKRANRRYIYAGSQSVGEVRNQQLSHSLMTGLQMDEHIARIALNQGATPQVKTYLTDALGSVIATCKADQSLEVGYAFSPYGQTQKVGVENEVAGSENSSQYTGRENDNNGLYFYRARYYDPILKRFISEDPIGLAGGINSHAYVEGDPVSFTDPEGYARRGGNPYGSPYGRPGGVVIGGKLPPISPSSRQRSQQELLDLQSQLIDEVKKWPDLTNPFNEGCHLHCPNNSCPTTYGNDRSVGTTGCILKCFPIITAPKPRI